MSSVGTAPCAAPMSTARAEASRRNGARSRGPKTAEGKARSAQNALKHGLRAEKFVVVGDEDAADYEAHAQALMEELAPEGVLQTLLVRRSAAPPGGSSGPIGSRPSCSASRARTPSAAGAGSASP